MAQMATITTKDVGQGLRLSVKVARSFTIRTKVACWLIGLAGRVMDVQCDVEMRDVSLRMGDVVRDRFTRKLMVVVAGVGNGRLRCACPDGTVGLFPIPSLERADAQA